MTSIGRRCKRGDALSRAVLIAREAFPFISATWLLLPRVGSPAPREAPSDAGLPLHFFPLSRCQDFEVSAVIDGGSYPFPFRTRKSSLLSPMVPGLRARESRSPPDPRGPRPKGRGPLPVLKRFMAFPAPPGGAENPLCQSGCRAGGWTAPATRFPGKNAAGKLPL